MAWEPKVKRHVTVLKFAGGTIKLKSGVITAFATDGNPVIRVGRKGETFGDATTGVARRTDVNEKLTVTKYISY